MTLHLRPARAEDFPGWLPLWQDYCGADLPAEAVTAHTWARMLDPNSLLLARMAERDGRLVGCSLSLLQETTWTIAPQLYLEDLFVAAQARGSGVGRALLDDALAQAQARGCSRLYWHCRADNTAARRLYDRYTRADDKVRYRMVLGPQ